MKTSFPKQDQASLFIMLTAGVLTAGTLSWLCLTKSGKRFIKCRLKDLTAAVMCYQTGLSRQFVRQAVDAIVD